jgi:signal recognition particle receptor subunit beta
MPHLDKKTGDVVIRIVYDGAAEAGKTTNVVRLSTQLSLQRRGTLVSPGKLAENRRTEFFDWLDFSGGFLDGRRVRFQLVSVPGQPELLHRRRYLLDSADTVVYVADARRECLDEARRNLAVTLSLIRAREAEFKVGVVVQANKQDLPGALDPSELGRELDLPPDIPVLEAVAQSGDGVMQTFILAARLATERVRSMVGLAIDSETPEELYSALRALEEELAAKEREQRELEGGRAADADLPLPPISLPASLEVAAGHVWPPVKGRALLAGIHLDGLRRVPPSAWAPPDTFELRTGDGFTLHSGDRWLFESENEAKAALLALVRQQVPWGELMLEARALFLTQDGDSWRVWLLTGRAETLRAAAQRDPEAARRLRAEAERFWERWRAIGSDAALPADLDTLAVVDGRILALGLDEGAPSQRERRPLPEQLDELARG